MATYTNKKCLACTKAYNGINGRFCPVLRRYVEYAKSPLCEDNIK
jgi:hypothetical protein